ncbi:MAG TPA: cob(I)yrinic acid a,c-diamide adenosyltransferase [Candidatus Angelobacter sp.]|nr:cob(I)yrinic acid a,c-diamide adenosyltransferase [Candidatus Angelobacter sp.]
MDFGLNLLAVSIVTKTGDNGTTALMYGRRVPKDHPRVEAYGAVDELNAALGLSRATAGTDFPRENLLRIQNDLVVLMGELATAPEDLPRFLKDGFYQIGPDKTALLEKWVAEIEPKISLKDWAMPGATMNGAALDSARVVCRRAERRVCTLQAAGQLGNNEIVVYLNRLADLLWLLARWAELKQP